MNISGPFIARSIATSLLMVAILLAGLLAYRLLPVSALPEVEYPTIQVLTTYPGASPEVMATYVTAPLERQFGQMPGLNEMTSSSSTGLSLVTLQFTLEMNLDVAEQEVQAAINAASGFLPTDLPYKPIYSKVNPADTPILTFALTSSLMPLPDVEDYAETRLAQNISQQTGVGLVSLSGGQRKAVRVQVNPTALAAYGLSLEQLRLSIVNANVNTAKGSFDGPRLAYTINANDQLLTAADYRPLIIAYNNGSPVRLSDVALVLDGAENTHLAAWMNQTPAIIMNVQRQPGANVIAVVDRVNALLQRIQQTLPKSIHINVLNDRTQSIRASVTDVQIELLISVLLVVLIIFLFLCNIPATLIPSISVPLSLIGTMGAMYLLSYSLDNLSLMALTIATGFVVDDAIVMIENISRYLELGESPRLAALKGAGQIGFTILSLTVSLIAVLIPLLFMTDVVGRLFREFAATLSITILISAFVSLTLTPMLCARILKKPDETTMNRFEKKAKAIIKDLIHRYGLSLQWVLRRQSVILAVAIATLIISGLLFYVIPKGFFPQEDINLIQGISEASQAISFSAMVDKQRELTKIVSADPAVANVSSFIGIDGTNTTLNSGRILISLKPISERKDKISKVISRLQAKIANIPGITLYMQAVQDLTIDTRVSRTQYQYSLSSPNANEVTHWTNLLVNKLKESHVLRDVASDQQNLGLRAFIDIDRDTASRLGLNTTQIDDTLYDAFGQRQISTIFTQSNQYRVILEVTPALQRGLDALNNIYLSPTVSAITTVASNASSTNYNNLNTINISGNTNVIGRNPANSGQTPINALMHLSETQGPIVIHRQGQFPVATISFNLAPNAALGDAIRVIEQAKTSLAIPDSVQTGFVGSAKIFQNSLSNESYLLLASVIIVYIILGVLYESYIHPLTILSTLPSAGMGALFALLLTGNSLSVIALIGIVLLIGIVMKNAILMIDFALEQERLYKKDPFTAIYDAALLRFRPILMTTMASMLGAVPLALGTGMGSELRNPLGIAIIGGLIVSQLLTLYTTPVIYLTFDKISRWVMAYGVNNRE